MAPRVSQQTRAILNTIDQLQRLQAALRKRRGVGSPGEGLKMRKVSYDVQNLITALDEIAGRMVTRAGVSVEEAKQKLSEESAKRRAGQLGAAEPCDPVAKADGPNLQGCMVALYPSAEIQKYIAVKGGERPDRIHLTLVFFEDMAADRDDWAKVGAIVTELAKHMGPLTGHLSGTGRFIHDDGEVAYATVSVEKLELFQEVLVEQLEKAGFPVSKKYPFRPHLTLKYTEPDEPFPDTPLLAESVPVVFEALHMVQGEEHLTVAPFKSAT